MAVSNGTVALEAAVRCLDLQPGDEVILPTVTIMSCVLAVLRGGADPILVDADPDTWCLDVGQVEAALTPRTRAIMPVHIYGHPVDMDPLLELADQHDLVLIEDAAEAHGGQYLRGWRDGTDTWQTCGSFGVVSCFSFYANKIISTGDERVGKTAVEVSERLAAHGVMTRPFFRGMHEQPALHRKGLFTDERYPVAERLARRGLYLPSGPTLTPAQLDQVCDALASVLT